MAEQSGRGTTGASNTNRTAQVHDGSTGSQSHPSRPRRLDPPHRCLRTMPDSLAVFHHAMSLAYRFCCHRSGARLVAMFRCSICNKPLRVYSSLSWSDRAL